MTATINISLNMPQGYSVERLRQQLTEYAQRLIAEDSILHEDSGNIELSPEMIHAAQQAEQDFRAGKCVGIEVLNKRMEKWL